MSVNNNRKALVTLVIGREYERMFARYCQPSWTAYCNKFSYDLIVITSPLDESARGKARSPSWQKLLILSQEWSAKYDQIVWLDTDIMINGQLAPSIVDRVPIDRIGAVEAYSIPTREIHAVALRRMYAYWRSQGGHYIDNLTPGWYYENRGIPGEELDKVVQGGVLVCSPKKHRAIFEHIYYGYEDQHKGAEWNYEMPAMSYELIKHDQICWLPAQFNFCVADLVAAFYPFLFHTSPSLFNKVMNKVGRRLGMKEINSHSRMREQALKTIFDLGYFVHFAGCPAMMEDLHSSIASQ